MSFKNYRRSIVLEFDDSAVNKGVADVNKQMALLNAEFRRASAEAELSGNTLDKLGINHQKLGSQLKLQADKVDKLKSELDKLNKSEEKNEKAITKKTIELKKAQTQLTKTQKEYNNLSIEVDKSNTLFGKAKNEIESFKLGAERAGVDLNKLKSQFMALGIAVTAFGVATAKASMDFDKEFAKVTTIADETQLSFEELRAGVLSVSDDIGIASGELANGLYDVISAGVQTSDSMKMLESSAKLARAGITDTTTSVDILTTIMNSYGYTVDDVTMLSDKLIQTQNLGKVTVGELGSEFGRVAALASSAKIPLDDMLGSIATLTAGGVKSNEAISGLKATISNIIKPSSEAAETAERLGVKFSASALESQGLEKFLATLSKRCKGNTEDMAKLFGSTEALNVVLALTGENSQKLTENIGGVNSALGTTDAAFNNITDNSGARMAEALNSLKNSAIEVGDALSPIVDVVASVVSAFAKLPAPIIITIGTVATLSITLRLLKQMFASVALGGGMLSGIMTSLGLTSGVAAAGMTSTSVGGGILSKVFSALGITTATTSASLGSVAATGTAAGTALGITGAATGTATAGLAATGVAGSAAGAGLMATGAGGTMAVGPILLVVVAVAALALVIGILIGKLGSAKSELNQVGSMANKTANDIRIAGESASKTVGNMGSATRSGLATGTNFVKQSGMYRINEYGQEEIYLSRGSRVKSAEQTRRESQAQQADNSGVESRLDSLLNKVEHLDYTLKGLPREWLRHYRGGALPGGF